jgi:hypothetical protein
MEDQIQDSQIDHNLLLLGRILGEILQLQRWAGGNAIAADRIHGLLNGFETAINEELDHFSRNGISEAQQNHVEDMLQAIDQGTASVDPQAIKTWLRTAGLDETIAAEVFQRCLLQSRFTDVINKIADHRGSQFDHLAHRSPFSVGQWLGSLHYIELVDSSGETDKKMHGVFAPCVPRIGEILTPEGGQCMQVVEVEHVVTTINTDGVAQTILVPHVYLEPVDQADEDETEEDEQIE